MVQLLIDRGVDVNDKGRVCHLFPVFCYNTVINVYPSCVGFKLLCSPGVRFVCACTNARRHVRAFLCVYLYVVCVYVCDCVHVCVCLYPCESRKRILRLNLTAAVNFRVEKSRC